MHSKEAGLNDNFQVIDSEDQLRIIKRIFKQLDINEERWEPKKVQAFINRKKDEGVRASTVCPEQATNIYERVMLKIYQQYEKNCHESSIVDFAELLLRSYELLNKNPELLQHYNNRFKHVLVDEFQDTNTIQYLWLKLLALSADSVTIVGDDDQSIYGWRGAKIENIDGFMQEFTDPKIVRLEQNYRSTSTILAAANALISNNDSRMGKTLWTDGDKGEPITVYRALNEEDEANFIVREVKKFKEQGGNLDQVGILYRSNAQSRVLEEAFMYAGVPYSIYGGLRFFDRAEIKDALAYLRLTVNHSDNVAFERILNVPPRGIGDRSLAKIREYAESINCGSLWQAAKQSLEVDLLSGKARSSLKKFILLIESFAKNAAEIPIHKLVEQIINESALLRYFKDQRGERALAKAENLEELVNATSDFIFEPLEGNDLDNKNQNIILLNEFLAYTSLDAGDRQMAEESVQLMTLHSAKGLEFPVVFICGVEEGLFPHSFCRDNPMALEEERRLCYVGVTRAKEKLHISFAGVRRMYGREEARCVSRFVKEIPSNLIKENSRRLSVSKPVCSIQSYQRR